MGAPEPLLLWGAGTQPPLQAQSGLAGCLRQAADRHEAELWDRCPGVAPGSMCVFNHAALFTAGFIPFVLLIHGLQTTLWEGSVISAHRLDGSCYSW